ncbi:MAG: hypothetical protein GX548_08810 [Lentisphaerae bacterium]|nr:hypothetical protein [Lentisphaerota bacterium]
MKVIHFILGLILYLSIAAAGIGLMVSSQYPEYLHTALAWARGIPVWGRVALGAGGIVYLFLFLLTGLAWRRRRDFIAFENENGAISVDVAAVQNYLDGLKTEFAAVASLKTHLQVVRGALAVGLVLGVKEGTRIPELCKLMQARVREILEEHLGTCELRGVAVEVNEIRARKKSDGESD